MDYLCDWSGSILCSYRRLLSPRLKWLLFKQVLLLLQYTDFMSKEIHIWSRYVCETYFKSSHAGLGLILKKG